MVQRAGEPHRGPYGDRAGLVTLDIVEPRFQFVHSPAVAEAEPGPAPHDARQRVTSGAVAGRDGDRPVREADRVLQRPRVLADELAHRQRRQVAGGLA